MAAPQVSPISYMLLIFRLTKTHGEPQDGPPMMRDAFHPEYDEIFKTITISRHIARNTCAIYSIEIMAADSGTTAFHDTGGASCTGRQPADMLSAISP